MQLLVMLGFYLTQAPEGLISVYFIGKEARDFLQVFWVTSAALLLHSFRQFEHRMRL